jgi:uncharacterized membrane protein YphA (DoxX/SURF4 family)
MTQSNRQLEYTVKSNFWRGLSSIFISSLPYQLIRWILSIVFLYSGISKLFDPRAFGVIIEAYGLMPEEWVMPVAIALPLLEVVTAVGLIWDVRGSLAVISGLLILFMLILGYGIHMGLDIDCGCFGPDDPEHRGFSSLRPALYRDILMLLGIIYLYGWRYWQKYKQH